MTEFNEAKELKTALEESNRAMLGAIEYLEARKPKRPEKCSIWLYENIRKA